MRPLTVDPLPNTVQTNDGTRSPLSFAEPEIDAVYGAATTGKSNRACSATGGDDGRHLKFLSTAVSIADNQAMNFHRSAIYAELNSAKRTRCPSHVDRATVKVSVDGGAAQKNRARPELWICCNTSSNQEEQQEHLHPSILFCEHFYFSSPLRNAQPADSAG